VGDPSLPYEREKVFRRNILLKALEALGTNVDKPTLFTVDQRKGV
jgi:hypothetical protein